MCGLLASHCSHHWDVCSRSHQHLLAFSSAAPQLTPWYSLPLFCPLLAADQVGNWTLGPSCTFKMLGDFELWRSSLFIAHQAFATARRRFEQECSLPSSHVFLDHDHLAKFFTIKEHSDISSRWNPLWLISFFPALSKESSPLKNAEHSTQGHHPEGTSRLKLTSPGIGKQRMNFSLLPAWIQNYKFCSGDKSFPPYIKTGTCWIFFASKGKGWMKHQLYKHSRLL